MTNDPSIDAMAVPAGDESHAGPPQDPFDESDDEAARLRRRRHVILGVVAAIILLAVWFTLHRAPKADFDDASQAPTVTVAAPGRTLVAGTINATGMLAARHDMPVGSVGDGGEVRQVLVNAGDWVHAGQLLATVDASVQHQQLLNQQANIGVAQADARLARANLDRALKLVDRGFISAADVDRLTATLDAANARVKVAVAQRDEMAARVHRLDIVAPADGLVLERDVEPGQVVGPASGTLFRIAEHGDMELKAKLSENDLTQLSLGQAAVVTPVGATKSFTGQVWQLSPVIDLQTRQGMARIALPYAPDLRPGGFATAVITSGTVVAPLLPESALQADARGSYVYVVGKGNKAERRPVTIGILTEKGIAIAHGLSGNEKVVLRAGAFLSEGETVNPHLVASALQAGSQQNGR
jgi:RND family efflux transporter MFP subunit